jgi:spermidine/putrescine transport system permease protein
MSVAVAREEAVESAAPKVPKKRKWTRWILPVYVGAVIFYLVLPILIMILYGFNNSGPKRVSFRWQGFSLFAYRNLFSKPDLTAALKNSLLIAVVATLFATAMGTLIALALVRYRYRGRTATDFVLFAAISAPEIVLGASLLSLFLTFGVPRGVITIVISHIMFDIAFVTVTVRARLTGFDRHLEEAAQDLYATPWSTFRRVTLPLIWPGIVAGGLLAFALSIDDFVITNFNAGSTQTFPLWVYGAVKVGIPPQVFAMGTIIFTVGAIIAVVNVVANRRRAA